MPTLTRFYVSRADCREWVKCYQPDLYKRTDYAYGVGALQQFTTGHLAKANKLLLLSPELMFCPDKAIDSNSDPSSGLMFVQHSADTKVYIPPDSSNFDTNGWEIIKKWFGVNASDWKVLWYNENDKAQSTEFVEPLM
ncbi:hypothetical protein FRC06_007642 [Ceratobasidium sp. 370]|nr:hypothetical protein FRC06_007642 [Ceratobasidium sp. 370]